MTTQSHLLLIRNHLRGILRKQKSRRHSYAIPSLWSPTKSKPLPNKLINVDPAEYFMKAIDNVLRQKRTKSLHGTGGGWTRHAVIFNMFVRSTCAFDHNGNRTLDLPLNSEGWRETGTFLKAIALLPYIKSLGTNTIHLLPITSIGHDGNKGTLGSPYAIRNPYQLDENLSEPAVGIGVDEEFKAFVEGAHHLGMRIVVEFVFRT